VHPLLKLYSFYYYFYPGHKSLSLNYIFRFGQK